MPLTADAVSVTCTSERALDWALAMPTITIQEVLTRAIGYHQAGRLGDAERLYHQILAVVPNHAGALHFQGVIALQTGRHDLAVDWIRQALVLNGNDPAAHSNLGEAYRAIGRFDDAIDSYRRAIQFQPNHPQAYYNLGNAFMQRGQIYEAIAAYRRALQLRPDHAEAHNNLGTALKGLGQLDEALLEYRRALQFSPGYWEAHSNLLYALHFHLGSDSLVIAEEHKRWNQQFAEPLRKIQQSHPNDRNPERRLRVGYVSPNFNRHPISHFFGSLLDAHDQESFEIFCYSSAERLDDCTDRMKKAATLWRDVAGLGDHVLSERIRDDKVDILVDLTQHMANGRLLMFARKPAPIQVAWLGYPATTGLPAMDYRFTDDFLDPEGSAWSESVETPIRLPNSWFCYDPFETPVPVALPALEAGHVTFGSLNNFSKVNDAVLRLWVKVLQGVEGSRLLLHCPAGETQARLLQWFEAEGIATHRVELVPRTRTRAEYLQLYQRIDIGLDSFPYNGGTTTCEALWMGVPVVSLAGTAAVSRLSMSVLTTAGLPEWVAFSEGNYIAIARERARDLPRLVELRAMLRTRMLASPLMDAPRFARNIEAAYRTMWRRWCLEVQYL